MGELLSFVNFRLTSQSKVQRSLFHWDVFPSTFGGIKYVCLHILLLGQLDFEAVIEGLPHTASLDFLFFSTSVFVQFRHFTQREYFELIKQCRLIF